MTLTLLHVQCVHMYSVYMYCTLVSTFIIVLCLTSIVLSQPAVFWMTFIDFRWPVEKDCFWGAVYYIANFLDCLLIL